jgi:hypothetical protein
MFKNANATQPKPPVSVPFFAESDSGARVELSDDAQSNGRRNLPPSDAAAPNEFEMAIIRQHEQDHLALAERSRATLQEQEAALARAEGQMPTPTDIDALVEKADAEVEHDLASNVTLSRKFDEYDRQDGNLRTFVRQNGLNREPHYPDSFIWRLLILTLIFVLETSANAMFFAIGNAFGYAGGFMLASFIAAANVGGGFLCGWRCLPYLHHILRGNRRRATIGFILYVAFAIVFNLTVAHFRDLHALSNAALRDSFGARLRGPFDLSFHSFLMLAVGMIACAIAIWEGYTADDRYPRYGDVHREYTKARDAYDLDKGQALQQVLAREKAVSPACGELVRKGEGLVEEMSRALVIAQKAADAYDTDREHIASRCEIYLRKYRDENKAIRRAPPPAYFELFPPLPELLDRAPIEAMSQRLQFARRALEALKAHAHGIKAESRRRLTEIARRFDEFLATRLPRHEQSAAVDAGEADQTLSIGGRQA